MFSTFRKRIPTSNDVRGILTKSKEYGMKASNLLNNIERVYRRIENEIPKNYRDDIQKGINSAQDYTGKFNRIVSAI